MIYRIYIDIEFYLRLIYMPFSDELYGYLLW